MPNFWGAILSSLRGQEVHTMIHPSLYLSIYPSIYLLIYLAVYIYVVMCIYIYIYIHLMHMWYTWNIYIYIYICIWYMCDTYVIFICYIDYVQVKYALELQKCFWSWFDKIEISLKNCTFTVSKWYIKAIHWALF